MRQANFVVPVSKFGGLMLLCVCVGCGSGERLYDLSGKATFQGKPIPEGSIVFEPDAAAGNSGPSGRCKILDGKFDTRSNDGRGTVGGPHVVTIVGLNGKIGGGEGNSTREVALPSPLFPRYSVNVDLPSSHGTMDFDVPRR